MGGTSSMKGPGKPATRPMDYQNLHADSGGEEHADFLFSRDESGAARKGIGEASMGFAVENRKKQLGMDREDAKELYRRLRAFTKTFQYNDDSFRGLSLSVREFRVLRNGLKLTLDELGEDEYYYRSGQQYEVAEEALAEFERVLAEIEAELE